ncbi:MAG: hypothetical protein KDD35_11120 [Bdellovibrionales bacterium]|nr:hypothetical protein [Bdellovibrionales bacterium]
MGFRYLSYGVLKRNRSFCWKLAGNPYGTCLESFFWLFVL